MGSKGRLTALAVVVSVVGGCETLRPEAAEPGPADGESERLVKAQQLIAEHASFPKITAALRLVLAESDDEDELERARVLIAQQHLQWFQLAHIASEALADAAGHERLVTGLSAELMAGDGLLEPIALTPPESKGGRRLAVVQALASVGPETPVQLAHAKRQLADRLVELERSPELSTRTFAGAGRRFLALESIWRYGRQWRTPPARVGELIAFANSAGAGGLADNAWLTLRLSFTLALDEPRVPRRSLVEAAAAVLEHDLSGPRRAPFEILLELGAGEGGTLPERLWASWRNLRTRIGEALKPLKPRDPGGADGGRLWDTLRRFLRLEAPPIRPEPADLYALGNAVRGHAVRDFLKQLELADLRLAKTIDALEAKARALYAAGDRHAVWVMTILTVQEALMARIAGDLRPHTIRLVDRATFEKRSLVLPGGIVYPEFPRKVRKCLAPTNPGRPQCLRRITEALAGKARANIDAPVPGKPRSGGKL